MLLSSSFARGMYYWGFRSVYGSRDYRSFWIIVSGLFGVLFLLLESVELYGSVLRSCSSSYCSSVCFLLGLHYLHVLLGLFMMVSVCVVTNRDGLSVRDFDSYDVGLVVGYWHFVDSMWLLVYFFAYVL